MFPLGVNECIRDFSIRPTVGPEMISSLTSIEDLWLGVLWNYIHVLSCTLDVLCKVRWGINLMLSSTSNHPISRIGWAHEGPHRPLREPGGTSWPLPELNQWDGTFFFSRKKRKGERAIVKTGLDYAPAVIKQNVDSWGKYCRCYHSS